MNLDELQTVQSRERQTDSLQQLRESFYADAGEFVQQLRTERERAAERADDPFDAPEVNRLTDDIKTAEQTVEAIYERRVGKIVKMASLAAADMPTEDDGLTTEERALFENLVGAIEDNRDHVLDVLAGEASPGSVTGGASADSSPTDTATPPESTPHDSSSADGSFPSEPGRSGPAAGDDSTTSEGAGNGSAVDSGPGAGSDAGPGTRTNAEPGDATAADSGDATVAAADIMGGESQSSTSGRTGEESDETPPPPPMDGAPVPGDGRASPEQPATPESSSSRDATGTAGTGSDPEPDGGTATVDRTPVRITDDVGSILGVDEREYDLSRNDVVELPTDNADPLVERGAAEKLE